MIVRTLALLLLGASAAQAACPTGAISVPLGQSIQAAVNAAPAGAKFCLATGQHLGQSVTPKANQEFHGEDGARMIGAKRLAGWAKEGNLWYVGGQTATPPTTSIAECRAGFPLCNQALGVFLASEPLVQAAAKSGVAAGTFWRDAAAGRIYIGANPTGKAVWVTTTEKAFHGTATGVVIKDLIVQMYGSKLQEAAIFGANATGWTIENVRANLNYAVGIDVGSNSVVRDSVMFRNGEMGLAFGGTGIVIENSRISGNGYWAGLDEKWEGGGFKGTEIYGGFTTVDGKPYGTGANIVGNLLDGNYGPGAWIDEGTSAARPNGGIVFRANTVRNNKNVGFSFEISLGPIKILDNKFHYNGVLDSDGWFWGGCLQIYDSSNAEVFDNNCRVSATHGNGMMVISQGGRIANSASGCGNYFHHNVTIFEGPRGTTGATGDNLVSFCGPNPNRFDYNRYVIASPAHASLPKWAWVDDEYPWATWRQRSGQEAHGTLSVGTP